MEFYLFSAKLHANLTSRFASRPDAGACRLASLTGSILNIGVGVDRSALFVAHGRDGRGSGTLLRAFGCQASSRHFLIGALAARIACPLRVGQQWDREHDKQVKPQKGSKSKNAKAIPIC
jgi:hypothetical protein